MLPSYHAALRSPGRARAQNGFFCEAGPCEIFIPKQARARARTPALLRAAGPTADVRAHARSGSRMT
jgi:hypothetical protein